MKSIYLAVIVILTSTVLTAQIKEVPIIGNPILQKIHQEEMAEIGMPDFDSNIQLRGHCPIENPDITYLFPADTFRIELDLSNDQAYELTDSSANIGTVRVDTSGEFAVFTAGNITGAKEGKVVFIKTVDGENPTPDEYRFIVKRRNFSTVLPSEILAPGENITICAEPTNSLPGTINCNDIFNCAANYGGNDLQVYFFESNASDENCFKYFSTRFPGLDTICVVLCDEFTVCDTFKQPFVIVGDTLDLPFFEDFSGGELTPSSDRWLENLVFVNQTMAHNPPSIGAATFEGLDASGTPYGGGYGTGDRLTSKAFDLSKDNVNSNLVLSFYHQLKGRGFVPRAVDSLMVDFWTDSSEWVNVLAIPGSRRQIAFDSFPNFIFSTILLDDPVYFHDGFQFRIRNKSERTGAFGTWHVDYIRLAAGDPTNQGFSDIAFSEPPGSVLERYTAIPIEQLAGFEEQEIIKEVEVKFFNHFNNATNPGDTEGFFSENTTGQSWNSFTLTNAQNFSAQEVFETQRSIPAPSLDPFIADLKNLTSSEDKLELKMNYSLVFSQDPAALQNDATCSVTPIDNYFAYDDGTAERALQVHALGTQLALEFEANVDGFLGAVKIHFPYTGSNFENQQFNLKIWANGAALDDQPTYEQFRISPAQPNFIQGFSTFNLKNNIGEFEPILIERGKFYIGIENATAETPAFAVGYDRNNMDASTHLWENPGGKWTKYTDRINLQGALMVRPVMTEVVLVSSDPLAEIEKNVTIYPNPAKEIIHFNVETGGSESYNLQIFNTLGQIIHQDILDSQLNISSYMAGIYFAKITNLKTGYVQNLQFFKDK